MSIVPVPGWPVARSTAGTLKDKSERPPVAFYAVLSIEDAAIVVSDRHVQRLAHGSDMTLHVIQEFCRCPHISRVRRATA
jgi:hypothetical protein